MLRSTMTVRLLIATLLLGAVFGISLPADSVQAAPAPIAKQDGGGGGGGGFSIPDDVLSEVNATGRVQLQILQSVVDAFVADIGSQIADFENFEAKSEDDVRTQGTEMGNTWRRTCDRAYNRIDAIGERVSDWEPRTNGPSFFIDELLDDIDRTRTLLSAYGPLVGMTSMSSIIDMQAENARKIVSRVDALLDNCEDILDDYKDFSDDPRNYTRDEMQDLHDELRGPFYRQSLLVNGVVMNVTDYLEDEPFAEYDATFGLEQLLNVGAYIQITSLNTVLTTLPSQLNDAQTLIDDSREAYQEAWAPITEENMLDDYPLYQAGMSPTWRWTTDRIRPMLSEIRELQRLMQPPGE